MPRLAEHARVSRHAIITRTIFNCMFTCILYIYFKSYCILRLIFLQTTATVKTKMVIKPAETIPTSALNGSLKNFVKKLNCLSMTFVRKLVKCANFYKEHKNSLEIETTHNLKSKFVKLLSNVFDNDDRLSLCNKNNSFETFSTKTQENIKHSL